MLDKNIIKQIEDLGFSCEAICSPFSKSEQYNFKLDYANCRLHISNDAFTPNEFDYRFYENDEKFVIKKFPVKKKIKEDEIFNLAKEFKFWIDKNKNIPLDEILEHSSFKDANRIYKGREENAR